MTIPRQEPRCRPNGAVQTVDEASVATEWHQSLYRSRHRVPHGYLLHRISSAITTFTLLTSNLHGNVNEPYGRVVHSTDHDRSKVDQAHQDRVDDTVGAQTAASSTGGNDDDDEEEDDPWERKIHNAGCDGDERPSGRNDDEHDHDDYNGFMREPVDVFGSDDPDDFPNIVFDDDMDIDEDSMVEGGILDEKDEEDSVGLWEE